MSTRPSRRIAVQSSESVHRVSPPIPTYERTNALTNAVAELGVEPSAPDAREKSKESHPAAESARPLPVVEPTTEGEPA